MKRLTFLCALTSLLIVSALPATALELVITFQSTVNSIQGPVPAGISLGSTVIGEARVNLETLPPDDHPFSTHGWYRYELGDAGFTISFQTGATGLLYDSANAASGTGLARGIFVQDEFFSGNDRINYQMQEFDDPSAVVLSFLDETSPYELVTEDSFPLAIDESTLTNINFQYFSNAQFSVLGFSSRVTSYEFAIVPEPRSALLLLAGGVFALASRWRTTAAAPFGPNLRRMG